jgi:hypothetical protein
MADQFNWPDYQADIAEAERLYSAVDTGNFFWQTDAQKTNEANLKLIREALDDMETGKLDAAKAGQMSWEEWQNGIRALGDACAKIADIDANFSYIDTFRQNTEASVERDVEAVVEKTKETLTLGFGVLTIALIIGAAIGIVYLAKKGGA